MNWLVINYFKEKSNNKNIDFSNTKDQWTKLWWMIYQYEKGSRARNYLLEHHPHVGWCWFLDLAPHHKRSESTLVQVLCSVFL